MSERDVTFETVKEEKITFGKNNFIEVARKRCLAPDQDSDNEFVAVSRGFFLPGGMPRYKKSIAVPLDSAIRERMAELIRTI
jgi:hypothetical protein